MAASPAERPAWRDLDRLVLRFRDRALEQRFRRSRQASELRYARIVLAFVIMLALAVVPLDLAIVGDRGRSLLYLGHALELVFIGSLLGLTFVSWFRGRHMVLMTTFAVVFTAIYAGWNCMLAVPDIYVGGGAVTIMGIYVLLPLDFLWGVSTALGCSALYLGVIGLGHPMGSEAYLTLWFFVLCGNVVGGISLYHIERLRRLDFARMQEVDAQRARYRDLLVRILPQSIAERLQGGERHVADHFDSATVVFIDIVGFTRLSGRHLPEEVVAFLDRVFAAFDAIVARHGAEKIKTIGDAYMIACGVPGRRTDHARRAADLALDIRDAVHALPPLDSGELRVRIGISTGPLVAGIIGETRFGYDLWGDTVNVASRMESYAEPGHIQVSEATYRELREDYVLEPRGEIAVKGLDSVPTWYLLGRKAGGAPGAEPVATA